ncbi:unnamed protein product [Notodromas monacha]|uniref:Uncharacterized protein n=1 Tax=Notodromas monacha TaxID=399045 RepID=A0A7R9BN12_9CRUS|nr:unnamed protein product [Notodromas monacha]CAG0918524.1 unnamed protein product [Notodromas monacha]
MFCQSVKWGNRKYVSVASRKCCEDLFPTGKDLRHAKKRLVHNESRPKRFLTKKFAETAQSNPATVDDSVF